MQVVGKIQAVGPTDNQLVERAVAVLDEWAGKKFEDDGTGYAVVRRSGVEALVDRREEDFDGSKLISFEVLEPVSRGQLQTHVRILASPQLIHFNCSLSLGTEGGLAPPEVDIYAPRFVREVVGLDKGWQFARDAEHILARFIDVGVEDVDVFLNLLQSHQRRLPLVVISEFNGRTIAGDLHTRVASDLCGLGHTCRLSRDAAWAITERLDKEWSVYNGGVRLFWPFRANREHPRNHPLWTYDALTRRGEAEPEIRDRLRRQLRERLLEASTFLSDASDFAIFEKARQRSLRDEANQSSAASSQAANEEIQALREALDSRDAEIATLKSNMEALTIALRSQAAPPDALAAAEAPPATVVDALQAGRRLFASQLAFGDKLDNQMQELSPGAGPPDKVLRYIGTLADLATALDAGPLGKSVPIWLRDAGVDASPESETIKQSRDSRRKRTFPIDGKDTYCEYHAKPSDGVSPDQCVRIYFTLADQAPRVRIGYLGRHFD